MYEFGKRRRENKPPASVKPSIAASVQGTLHSRIRQTKPLLQEMNAQHGLEGEGRMITFGTRTCRSEWLDQTYQLTPQNNQVHLIEKQAFTRAFGEKLESVGDKADLFYLRSNQ